MKYSKSKRLEQIHDPEVTKRFLEKLYLEGSCWFWTGFKSNEGYGQFWYDGKSQKAHRVAYAIFVGTIEEGMTIDHTCHNRSCCNPSCLIKESVHENCRKNQHHARYRRKKC